ncbi:unnamed protein product [Onchocerca ochengi]|uniref:Bestrophin homolog n=1 Tax=Onchocerca ochengi TaxID=42157 RepID=A0A182EXZ9_ONCOC|nr:unnamed protein product [Onchocerca ochengi]
MIWKSTISKAPWGGDVYERVIGVTKRALRRAIGRKLLKEKELIALIVEIEAILNSRPLTYVGFDDYRTIHPIDFLSPTASLDIPTNADTKDNDEYTSHSLSIKNELLKQGMDGKIRSGTIQLSNGKELNRSFSALYPLELDDAEPLQDRSISTVEKSDEEPIAQRTRNAKKRQTKNLLSWTANSSFL